MSDSNSDKEMKELKNQLKPLLDVNPEIYDIILEKFRMKNVEIIEEKEIGQLLKERNETLSADFDVWKNDCAKIKKEMSSLQKILEQSGGLEALSKKAKEFAICDSCRQKKLVTPGIRSKNVKKNRETFHLPRKELKRILLELTESRKAFPLLKEQLRKVWEDKLKLVKEKNEGEEKLKMLIKQNQKLEEMLKAIVKQENMLVIERNKKFDEIAGKGNKSRKMSVSLQQFISTVMPEWNDNVVGFMDKKLPDLKKKYDEAMAKKKEQQPATTGTKTRVTVKLGQDGGIVKALQQAAAEISHMDGDLLKETLQQLIDQPSIHGKNGSTLCHHHREEKLVELEKRIANLVAVTKEQSESIANTEKKFKEAREEVERFKLESQIYVKENLAESGKQIFKLLALTKEQSELISTKDNKIKDTSEQVARLKTCLLNVSYQMAKKLSELWITKDSLKKKHALLYVMKKEIEDQTTELLQVKGILRKKDVQLMVYKRTMCENSAANVQQELTDLKASLLEIRCAMGENGKEKP